MKYHNAIQAIQDAIEILGHTLQIADVQRKYGFEELRGQALEQVLSLAAECPQHERSVWSSAMLHFADLNSQLAELGVAPLALPSYEDFIQLLEDWRLRASDDATVGESEVDETVETIERDFFATLLDPELEYAERASRVMARIRQQKQQVAALRKPAPVGVVLSDEDKPIVEEFVRLALKLKGFEEHVFQVLLEQIGENHSWRFDEAAETAWRDFFCERVTNAFIADAA